MADRPTGIVTFLFTDIEGSTTRWEHHREAMQHAVARHDSVMRQAITSHAGHVFKTVGDAFYSTFDSPLDAIEAACDAQCALLNEDWGDLPAVRVRMAVHTGSAESRDHDYFGRLGRSALTQARVYSQRTSRKCSGWSVKSR